MERNAPDILTADNANEADEGRRTAAGIREIRVIRGQWIEKDRRSPRASSGIVLRSAHERLRVFVILCLGMLFSCVHILPIRWER